MDIRNYFSAPNTTKKLEKKTSAEKPSKDTAIKKKKPKRRIPDSDDELSDPNKASKSNTSTPSPSESEEIVNKKSVRSIRSKTTKSNSNEVDDDEISPYNSTSENLEIFSSPRSSTRKSTLVERKTPETTPKKRQSFEANISDDDYFPPEEEALPTKKTKHEQKNVEEKSPSKRAIKSPRSKKGKPHDVDNDDEMNIAETTDQIKNKTGPTASESKEIPQGEDMCLFGKTFVFTGDLDTLDREEAQDIVKRNGGRVTLQPSSRTSYVVVGKDPGPKKMEKVEQFKIPTLNEEQLLELIRTSPKKSSSDVASIKKSPKSKAPITKISEAIASVTSTDAN
ncbi:15359_t:CDS:2, partial [Funneliformis caledonium]